MKLVLLTLAIGGLATAKCSADELRLKPGDRLVFLGDSITEMGNGQKGFVTLIGQALSAKHRDWGIEVVNAGISGNKVPDLQARLEKDVLARKPTVVIVYIGINDVWHSLQNAGTPKDRYESGLTDVLSRIQKTGARVLLCTPSVIGEKIDGINPLDKMLDDYSEISRQVAATLGVPVCDLRKAFTDYLKVHNEKNLGQGILTADSCHLNDAGNEWVVRQIWQALGEYDPKAATRQENAWILPDLSCRPFPMGMTAIGDAFAKMRQWVKDGKTFEATMAGYAVLRDIDQAHGKAVINNLEAIIAKGEVGAVLVDECEQAALLGKDGTAYTNHLNEIEDLAPKAWVFHPDNEDLGILEKWFDPGKDRTGWKPIDVRRFWQEQGNHEWGDLEHPGSLSLGWYCLKLDVPKEWATRDLYLWFTCDEDASIWVNGTPVKVRDEGYLSRWSVPSLAPLSGALRPGETNTIVVRVHNTRDAGGLWRGVRVLEPKGCSK